MKRFSLLSISFLFVFLSLAQSTKRTLRPGDIYRLQNIADASISPDGAWIAYTVSTIDSAKDRRNADIWMVSWDGKQTVQLTNSPENESSPRWSPDGKYISFVAARLGGSAQVWVLDRRGGEGIKLTDVKGDITTYSWSPDSKKLLLAMKDPKDTSKTKPPTPYVINKFRFKQDVSGYQYDTGRTHLYLYDIATKKNRQLTNGIYNETNPKWSPAGDRVAFVSNRTKDPDRNENNDIWLIDTAKTAMPTRLTTWTGGDSDPQWSPDGKSIAYVRTTSSAVFEMYDQTGLCLINAAGGEPKLLSSIDRPVSSPRWAPDGKTIFALVADDMKRSVSSFDVAKGTMKTVAGGDRSFTSLEPNSKGGWAAFMSEPQAPAELVALEGEAVRRITTLQNKFLDSVMLAEVEKFVSTSKDGTKVSGLIYYPPGLPKQKLPLLFYIHGGPVGQDELSFDLTRQMFAAHGYAVAGVNYRGSLGRGLAFSKAISGDWGKQRSI